MAFRGNRRSSLSYAVESSEGSLDANGDIDVSALTFAGCEVLRFEPYETQDEPFASSADVAKSSPGELPDVAITTYSAGSPQQRRTGTMSVKPLHLRSAPATVQLRNTFIGAALRTAFGIRTVGAGATETVVAPAGTANAFSVTNPGNFTVGQMIAVTINRRLEFAWVTDITAAVLTVSPAFTAAPAVNDLVRQVVTFYPIYGDINFGTNPSLAFRYDQDGKRFVATGVRLKRFEVEVTEASRVPTITAMEFELPLIEDDDGNAAPVNPPAQGAAAMREQAYDVAGSLLTAGTPAAAARTQLVCRRWKFSAEVTWRARTTGESRLGHAGMHVVDSQATVSNAIEPLAAFDTLRREGFFYHLIHGLGPTSAAADGAQMGWGFGLKAAKLASWAKVAAGDAETVQDLSWTAGHYEQDTGTWANGLVDAPWTFGAVA